jgi:hypothetical protein
MVEPTDVERSVRMFKRYSVLMTVVVLLMAFTVPAAIAGPKGEDRPFKADTTGFALYGAEGGGTYGLLNVFDCDEAAPDKLPPEFEYPLDDEGEPMSPEEFRAWFQVTTYASADGIASHLGKVHLETVHCPGVMGPVNGQLALVAANGDVLYGEYRGMGDDSIAVEFKPVSTMGRACELRNEVPCESTGRFSDVEGSATLIFDVVQGDEADPFVPWPWWGEMTGELSY